MKHQRIVTALVLHTGQIDASLVFTGAHAFRNYDFLINRGRSVGVPSLYL